MPQHQHRETVCLNWSNSKKFLKLMMCSLRDISAAKPNIKPVFVGLPEDRIQIEEIELEYYDENEDDVTVDYLEELPEETPEQIHYGRSDYCSLTTIQRYNNVSSDFPESISTYEISLDFPCEICDEHFTTREERNVHIQNHFRSYVCERCKGTFIGERQYNYHRQAARCKPKSATPDPMPVPDNGEESYTEWSCYICGQKNFYSKRALRLHMNKEHRLKSNKNQDTEETHICDICEKQFANRHILKNHRLEIHTNAQQHVCDHCGKSFNRLANLKHHELIHLNLMPCKCTVCGKAFRTSSGVRLHMRMHTGAKPYQCDMCIRSYAYNTDLVRHKRSAHNICSKVYQCALCHKEYYERKHLRKHLLRSHSVDDADEHIITIRREE